MAYARLKFNQAQCYCLFHQSRVDHPEIQPLRTVRPIYRTATLRYHPDVAFYIFFFNKYKY
jgi:hypothetical protein